MRMLAAMLAVSVLAAGCSSRKGARAGTDPLPPETTYGKILARARAGDAQSQHAVGFMLFFGEGVPRNRVEAHRWFHRAADQGDPRAQRNLAIMHYLGEGVPPAPEEAAHYLGLANAREPGAPSLEALAAMVRDAACRDQRPRAGEGTYVTFCAGCHGFNGIAEYVRSPSFALGERLEKSDGDLLRSIEQGIGEMPKWDNKLPRAEMAAVLGFVRTLRQEYRAGIVRALRARPRVYFVFGAMQRRLEQLVPHANEDDVERLLRSDPQGRAWPRR